MGVFHGDKAVFPGGGESRRDDPPADPDGCGDNLALEQEQVWAQEGVAGGAGLRVGAPQSHCSFVRDFTPLGLLAGTLLTRCQTVNPNFLPFSSVPVTHRVS